MQHKFVNKHRLSQPLDRMWLAWVKLVESMHKGQFLHLAEVRLNNLASLHLNRQQPQQQPPRYNWITRNFCSLLTRVSHVICLNGFGSSGFLRCSNLWPYPKMTCYFTHVRWYVTTCAYPILKSLGIPLKPSVNITETCKVQTRSMILWFERSSKIRTKS